MRNSIWIAAPALALAACAEQPAAEEANVAEAPNSNAAQPAPDEAIGNGAPSRPDGNGSPMAWNFSTAADGAKLAYGEPRTDNVRLTLRCAGGGRIELSFIRSAPGEAEQMTVRSGGASETMGGSAEESQLGGWFVRAELPASAAPLQRFRGGNSLTVEWASETRTVPPAGPEAERFFGAC